MGVITATHFYGDGSNLTGISAGTSLTGSTNNTVCTVTGANAIQGEANLIFDGTDLGLGVSPNNIGSLRTFHIKGPSGQGAGIRLQDDGDTADSNDFTIYKNYAAGYLRINGTDPLIAYLNGADRLHINSNGKIGIGGAPSAWQAATTTNALQLGTACLFNYNNDYFHVGQNFYYDGSNYKYVANDPATRLLQDNGQFTFYGAASGSADANITWIERLRIDSSGRMTQNGTTSADTASALTLKNGNASNDHTILELISDPNQLSMIYFGASDDRYQGQIRYKDNDHYMAFYTDQTERMRINSDGTVYFSENIASQSPSGQFGFRMDRGGGNATSLQVENYNNDSVNNNAQIKLVTNHSNVRMVHHNQGGFYIINSGNGYFHYYQNGQSTFFVDTNGNFCVGTTSASSGTQAKGISLNQDGAMISRRDGVMHYYKSISTGGYYANVFLSANTTVGSIYFNSGGTQFNTSSDYRRKENVVSLTDGISKIKQLKPYRFNFKDNPSETVDGFLAHEAQEIVPHTVTGTKDQISTANDVAAGIATTTGEPIYQQMDLSKLVPLLTAALQELDTKVETLSTRVETLEQENITLRARVTNLEDN